MTGARDAIATGPGSGCHYTQMQDSEVFTGLTGLNTRYLDAKIVWLWLWLWTDHIVEATECRADQLCHNNHLVWAYRIGNCSTFWLDL